MSTILPSDLGASISGDYHVTGPVHEVPQANYAVLLGEEGGRVLLMDSVIRADPLVAPPLLVQKVGRNHPCPCGSGEKFKRCHGR